LTPAGCELGVIVGVSRQRADALRSAGRPIPDLQLVRMIIDTGATASAIDEKVVKHLGLSPTGITQILTPSTKGVSVACANYDVFLAIDHAKYPLVHTTLPMIASNFSGQNIQGLIGCDVLQQCLFILDGAAGNFTLAF
jgi:hypothetical protein